MDNSGFQYIDGHLHCDGIPVTDIAEEHGTPCFIYSKSTLLNRLNSFRNAFSKHDPLICFSVKSLANLSILRLIDKEDCGFDIVSGGELYRVLQAGGAPGKTVFAGVGKTEEEIKFALKHQVHMFNVESESEMRLIAHAAAETGHTAAVAIRVNPDVDARTHEKTTTGKKENKFGIDPETALELAKETRSMPGVILKGLHMHLGSPIYDTQPYVDGLKKIIEFKKLLEHDGLIIDTLNIGGGYCMSYTGREVLSPQDYADAIGPILTEAGADLILEPGRHIAAPSGILLTKTIHTKETGSGKKFIIVDAAMNNLLRPTLYDAFHRIWPADSPTGMPEVIDPEDSDNMRNFDTERVDVVGPVCESGDCLAKDRRLPALKTGDLLSIYDAGAYGQTMSSNYNGRPKAPEVITNGGSFVLISKRESYKDLIAGEELTCI